MATFITKYFDNSIDIKWNGVMAHYCEICGEELEPDEEYEGICKKCKSTQDEDEYKSNEEFIDPGVT